MALLTSEDSGSLSRANYNQTTRIRQSPHSGAALDDRGGAQYSVFFERPANNLHADGQAGGSLGNRNDSRRQAKDIGCLGIAASPKHANRLPVHVDASRAVFESNCSANGREN